MWGRDIPDWSTATNPVSTNSTDPGTTPLMFYTGGSQPVDIKNTDGTQIKKPDVQEMEVTVNNNLERIWILGQALVKFMPFKERRITGRLVVYWNQKDYYPLLLNDTFQDIVWRFHSNGTTLTLEDAKFRTLSAFTIQPLNVIQETYEFAALTANLSAI